MCSSLLQAEKQSWNSYGIHDHALLLDNLPLHDKWIKYDINLFESMTVCCVCGETDTCNFHPLNDSYLFEHYEFTKLELIDMVAFANLPRMTKFMHVVIWHIETHRNTSKHIETHDITMCLHC